MIVTDTFKELVLVDFLFHSSFLLTNINQGVADDAISPSIIMWIPPTVNFWRVQHVHLINKMNVKRDDGYLQNILKIRYQMRIGVFGPN